MSTAANAFRTGRASEWTRERLDQLGRQEMLNLRANAERLGEAELTALCDELLKLRPARGPKSSGAAAASRAKGPGKLLPRGKAFGTRGVFLDDPRTSWSGVRKADG